MNRVRPDSKHKSAAMPLSRIVSTRSKSYASTSIESDIGDAATLESYIPGSGAIDTVSRLGIGMRGGRRGRMISVTGPYGSGKSAMAVFIDALAAGINSRQWKTASRILREASPKLAATFKKARGDMGIQNSGMIRCAVMAQREPITATILRALDSGARRYFGKYTNDDFEGADRLKKMKKDLAHSKIPDTKSITDVIAGMCKARPILFIIDEFGKNIEYFTDNSSQESDLFLLQTLAEMSGRDRKIPLFMITLQHMAFEEYAVGASTVQRQEWAKVQGRFDDVPVSNSPEQARMLIAGSLKLSGDAEGKKEVQRWARKESKSVSAMGLGWDINPRILPSYYPLHPLVVEILPEMCSRYGQYERTLLAFVTGEGRHTVSRFIKENTWVPGHSLPTVGLDTLYDYFVSGSPLINSISSNMSKLMEIETIIRDTHGLSDEEVRILKSIGVLNLVGRSGRLRASRSMIRYATGRTDSDKTLRNLEDRSIVTYRRYADEYRIWHGTDVDIVSKMEIARRRLGAASLTDMLERVMPLDPIVAAKHAIETGTTRIFERRFMDPDHAARLEPKAEYDGLVAYMTGKIHKLPRTGELVKPVILVEPENIEPLREAAVEAASTRDVLDRNPEIAEDWVARRELNERLMGAESSIEKAFESAFGDAKTKWRHLGYDKRPKTNVIPSTAISDACDAAYDMTPRIFNEMINRNVLTPQGSTALKALMEAMITNHAKPLLGIEGWGPERAMYGAVLARTGIHNGDINSHGICEPQERSVRRMWKDMIQLAESAWGRLPVEKIYERMTLPPFGAKRGYIPIILTALLIANRDQIAVYEHGTYCREILPEIAERLVKNPGNFEIKYFANSKSHRDVLESMASRLGLDTDSEPSMLDIVGHLVTVFSQLTPHVKRTKRLSRDALTIRDAIASAREPDALLFEMIPEAVGFGRIVDGRRYEGKDVEKLSKGLAKAVTEIQSAFDAMLANLKNTLFEYTGIKTRDKLSSAASAIMPHVQNKEMEVFLTAVSNDMLDDDDWIKYVALTVTGVPPADWTDDQRKMFGNRLQDTASRFRRLASMYFDKVSDSFQKPTYRVTVTQADGGEKSRLLSVSPDHRMKLQKIADKTIRDMKKKKFTDGDIDVLAAMLMSELR